MRKWKMEALIATKVSVWGLFCCSGCFLRFFLLLTANHFGRCSLAWPTLVPVHMWAKCQTMGLAKWRWKQKRKKRLRSACSAPHSPIIMGIRAEWHGFWVPCNHVLRKYFSDWKKHGKYNQYMTTGGPDASNHNAGKPWNECSLH